VSVQQAFAHHLVYAPDRDFADMVKDEMALFPKGCFKDLTTAPRQKPWLRGFAVFAGSVLAHDM
jgi:hypothetical protein